VRFPTLTGGSGLTAATTNYFVRDISGDTFKVSTTSGGSAVNFTTNITAGTVVAMQEYVALVNNAVDTNSGLVLLAKGNGAVMLQKPDGTTAGGNPRGANAVDLQTIRNGVTQVASGEASAIIGGRNNIVSGTNSVAIGGANKNISGNSSVAIGGADTHTLSGAESSIVGGRLQTASGNYTGIFGGRENTANTDYATVLGSFQATADRFAMIAHSAGRFAAGGDAQRARFVLRCKTTTNAAVEMALNGTTTYLTIPSGKVIFCNIKVVGVKSDGSVVATYERQYAAKNMAGTSSEVYAAETIGTDNASSTSLEVATVDAGDYIRIRPTGITSETWRWVASVDAVEVAYGT
jgi:hypothetical protein